MMKAAIFGVFLTLVSTASFAQDQQVCANFNEPPLTAASGSSADHLAHLPKDAPSPAYR